MFKQITTGADFIIIIIIVVVVVVVVVNRFYIAQLSALCAFLGCDSDFFSLQVMLSVLGCRLTGTSWDQCVSMVQYSFTSTETRRLVSTDSPGRPPRLSHSSSTMWFRMMMMSWCLVSSDVSWHIRDKLWPMPKHGSINLYVHGNQKAR